MCLLKHESTALPHQIGTKSKLTPKGWKQMGLCMEAGCLMKQYGSARKGGVSQMQLGAFSLPVLLLYEDRCFPKINIPTQFIRLCYPLSHQVISCLLSCQKDFFSPLAARMANLSQILINDADKSCT